MISALITSIVDLLIICPLLFIYRKLDGQRGKALLGFGVFFIVNHILLRVSGYYNPLEPLHLQWNWTGKAYALMGSAAIYWLYRKTFRYHDFFTWNQKAGSLPSVSMVAAILLIPTIVGAFFLPKKPFDAETLAFQLTMPGLDEEVSYRGIMLGLLLTALAGPIRIGKYSLNHPAVWITALLFGLAHGFHVTPDWAFRMNWGYFGQTFLTGWLLGWVAVESRSLVFPVLLHNLINFLSMLILMIA